MGRWIASGRNLGSGPKYLKLGLKMHMQVWWDLCHAGDPFTQLFCRLWSSKKQKEKKQLGKAFFLIIFFYYMRKGIDIYTSFLISTFFFLFLFCLLGEKNAFTFYAKIKKGSGYIKKEKM